MHNTCCNVMTAWQKGMCYRAPCWCFEVSTAFAVWCLQAREPHLDLGADGDSLLEVFELWLAGFSLAPSAATGACALVQAKAGDAAALLAPLPQL